MPHVAYNKYKLHGHPKNTSEVGPEVKLHHGKLGPWIKSALWHIDV